MPRIDPDRLMADLHALSAIGAYKTGVHRPTLSRSDMQARRWLLDRLREAGSMRASTASATCSATVR